MNEKLLSKKLKSIFIFSICILVLLGLFAYIFTSLFIHSIEVSTNEKLENEVQYYKGRITRQIDRNIELLETISVMIGEIDIDDEKVFMDTLKDIDHKNDFVSLSYFNISGRGYVSVEEDDIVYVRNISSTDRMVQNSYSKAIRGNNVISNTFKGPLSDQEVFMMSVPVYKNNKITGVLNATDVIEAFSDEINKDAILYGYGHLHLLDNDGNFLVDGNKIVEDAKTIFREPYLKDDMIADVKERMKNNERIYFGFDVDEYNYQVILEPLGLNNWYLFCFNSLNDLNRDLIIISMTIASFFVIIFSLLTFILLYVYKTVKRNNKELRQIACFDRLTGLNNLYYFLQLAKDKISDNRSYSIVVLNIKHFKFINEIFGRDAGNNLLKDIASILKENTYDDEILCRESSDIFYLLLEDTNKDIIAKRLNNIIKEICDESDVSDTNYQLVIRCGIAVSFNDDNLELTMNHAMFALARNKENNRESMWFFDSDLHKQEKMDNYIESHAKEAIEKREFKVFLQPKIDLKTNELCSAEALARWIKDDGTIIYPGSFIALFEKNGFTVDLDLYMFEEVCKLIRYWLDNNIKVVPISINQSKLTLFEKGYIDSLVSILTKYNLSAKYFILEILERLAIDNIEELNNRLNILKKIGFKISLDDFGTGYSSLNSLGKLNVDEIKIDRSFLVETISNKNLRQQILMKEIINFSSKLQIKTVVEGVETEVDYNFVKEIGSDIGQGYYFNKPLSADDFTQILKKG